MDRPILFNTEMVKAILEGRKTVTRRIAKHLCGLDPRVDGLLPENFKFWVSPLTSVVYWEDLERQVTVDGKLVLTPCWRNDILWVRETWRPIEASSAGWCRIEYKAGGTEYFKNVIAVPNYHEPWHPSIHMPKEAARIFLRVKDVRVDRLRNMGYSDLANEGFGSWERFISLWDSTIKPEDCYMYEWNANPWVWVIEFERCEKPEGWPQCR